MFYKMNWLCLQDNHIFAFYYFQRTEFLRNFKHTRMSKYVAFGALKIFIELEYLLFSIDFEIKFLRNRTLSVQIFTFKCYV